MRDRLNELRDRLVDALAEASPRDRALLAGLSVSLLTALLLGGALWMRSSLRSLEDRVEARRDALHTIQALIADYDTAEDEARRIEEQLRRWQGQDLSSFLEQTASKVDVRDKLQSVREKSASSDGNLVEKVYAVSLDRLTLEELAGFLYEAETAGYPMRIVAIKVKTRRRRDERLLDVDMDIAAYRIVAPAEDAGEGEG